jgi:hypothetical protein
VLPLSLSIAVNDCSERTKLAHIAVRCEPALQQEEVRAYARTVAHWESVQWQWVLDFAACCR